MQAITYFVIAWKVANRWIVHSLTSLTVLPLYARAHKNRFFKNKWGKRLGEESSAIRMYEN